jgi:nitrogen fixation protein FixH
MATIEREQIESKPAGRLELQLRELVSSLQQRVTEFEIVQGTLEALAVGSLDDLVRMGFGRWDVDESGKETKVVFRQTIDITVGENPFVYR